MSPQPFAQRIYKNASQQLSACQLQEPVFKRRDAQRSFFPILLRYVTSPHQFGAVPFLSDSLCQRLNVDFQVFPVSLRRLCSYRIARCRHGSPLKTIWSSKADKLQASWMSDSASEESSIFRESAARCVPRSKWQSFIVSQSRLGSLMSAPHRMAYRQWS
jgi:hypothetical protein